jgi:hypothetical protein
MADKIKKIKEVKVEVFVPVKLIMSANNSALVEYIKDGTLVRATVPYKYLVDGKVKDTILDRAIKFGIDWSELKFPPILAGEINRQLRIHGIWTAQDARLKPGLVTKAVMSACTLEDAERTLWLRPTKSYVAT